MLGYLVAVPYLVTVPVKGLHCLLSNGFSLAMLPYFDQLSLRRVPRRLSYPTGR
jgi:hypothetical protein